MLLLFVFAGLSAAVQGKLVLQSLDDVLKEQQTDRKYILGADLLNIFCLQATMFVYALYCIVC